VVDAPDAAELVGCDSLQLLLRIAALQKQHQQQQQALQLLQERITGLAEGQALRNCHDFETLVPDHCRLEYWRMCVDAHRQAASNLDACQQLRDCTQKHSSSSSSGKGGRGGSNWEYVQLWLLLQEHAGLTSPEAEQLSSVCCGLSEQLTALQACSIAAAGRKPIVLRRSLRKSMETPAVHVRNVTGSDGVAEDAKKEVQAGHLNGRWSDTYSRVSSYELLPGLCSECTAAAAGTPGLLADAAVEARRLGPVAAYGLAVHLVREALHKLPQLHQVWQQQQQQQCSEHRQLNEQQLDDASGHAFLVGAGKGEEQQRPVPMRQLLRSTLLPRLQLLRQLHYQLHVLLLAAQQQQRRQRYSLSACTGPGVGLDAAHLLRQDFQQQESLQQLLLLAAGCWGVCNSSST
jgi:hypothetical protein